MNEQRLSNDPEGLSNIGQAVAFFGVSRSTWANWEKAGKAPVRPVNLNGRKMFRNREMLEAINNLKAM